VRGLVHPDLAAGRRRFRRDMAVHRGPRTDVGAVRDFTIEMGPAPLAVRHYAPPSAVAATPAPLLVYLHGGGFCIGDLDTHDEACRLLCRHGALHVLAVDYRLAPEHPFPAALQDANIALRWARAHADALGADPARVAIGGDSAGANLATVAARQQRTESDAAVAQLLLYPPTDSGGTYPSHALFGEGYFLDRADREVFTRAYLGAKSNGADPRVSPLRAPDLAGLPPAMLVTAGFDILRDEGEAYAEALRAAGTPVLARRYPSLGHGFVNVTGVCRAARAATIESAHDFRALLDALP
jgi:acetyl esterase